MVGGRPVSHLVWFFFLSHTLPSPNGSERKLIMLLQVSVLYFLYFTITNVPSRPDRGIGYELFGLQIKSIFNFLSFPSLFVENGAISLSPLIRSLMFIRHLYFPLCHVLNPRCSLSLLTVLGHVSFGCPLQHLPSVAHQLVPMLVLLYRSIIALF